MTDHFVHGYALLIGVGASAYPKWSLPVTINDARAIYECLTDPMLCAYLKNEQHIRLLHDEGATHMAILDQLRWLQECAHADDQATVVIYFSGHGWQDEQTSAFYLIPHDVEPFDVVHSALAATAFMDEVNAIAAHRLLVMIDSCHAAGMATAKDGSALRLPPGMAKTALPQPIATALSQGQGRAVFSSSRGDQLSWVHPNGEMSIYTYHLLEALQGAGNQEGDTTVRLSNMMTYLGRQVPESVRRLCNSEQTPFFDVATEDFSVAMLRGGKGLPKGGWEAIQQMVDPSRQIQVTGERNTVITGDSNAPVMAGDIRNSTINFHR